VRNLKDTSEEEEKRRKKKEERRKKKLKKEEKAQQEEERRRRKKERRSKKQEEARSKSVFERARDLNDAVRWPQAKRSVHQRTFRRKSHQNQHAPHKDRAHRRCAAAGKKKKLKTKQHPSH
jgi:hypothetical protein